MNITLEEIKQQCRVDDDESDELLTVYLQSAKAMVENETNRPLFDSLPDNAPSNALVISGDIKIAVLMLTAYLFENRGGWNESSGGAQFRLPPTVDGILSRYRFIPV